MGLLDQIDSTLNSSYDSLLEETQMIQMRLYMEDEKIRKKAKKMAKKKNPKKYYNEQEERRKVREEIVYHMEEGGFFDRVMIALKDIAPVIIVLARLVAGLICALLSMDVVKAHIGKGMLEKLNAVYSAAMAIG